MQKIFKYQNTKNSCVLARHVLGDICEINPYCFDRSSVILQCAYQLGTFGIVVPDY